MSQQTLDMMYLCCRGDISSGHLPASFVSHVLLGALAKTVENKSVKRLKGKLSRFEKNGGNYCKIGDKRGGAGGIVVPFAPNESQKLTTQISELHRSKKSLKHRECTIQYLELASKLQLFGVQCHIAKDHHNIDIQVGISPIGIHIYHNDREIVKYLWITIKRIFYRQNKFFFSLINNHNQEAISFDLPSPKEAKRLMREACEKHAFYRLRPRSMMGFTKTNQNSIKSSLSPANSTSTIFSNTSSRNSSNSIYSTFSRQSTKSSVRKFVSNIFLDKEINPADVLFGRSQSELIFHKQLSTSLSSSTSIISSSVISNSANNSFSRQTSLYSSNNSKSSKQLTPNMGVSSSARSSRIVKKSPKITINSTGSLKSPETSPKTLPKFENQEIWQKSITSLNKKQESGVY